MTQELWWLWILAGIFLIILEIFTAGFIVMWFGIAAIISAVPAYLGASIELIILVYCGTVFLLTIFVRKITMTYMHQNEITSNTNTDVVLNSKGVVLEDINPINGKGLVRIAKEVWTAESYDNSLIPKDSIIKVVNIKGVRVIVKKEEN